MIMYASYVIYDNIRTDGMYGEAYLRYMVLLTNMVLYMQLKIFGTTYY